MKKKIAAFMMASLLLAFPAYAYRTLYTHTTVSVGAASGLALAANGARNSLVLQNDHATQVVYCKFGATAVLNQGIRVNAAGGILTFDYTVPTGLLNCIATGAATPLLVTEGVQQ